MPTFGVGFGDVTGYNWAMESGRTNLKQLMESLTAVGYRPSRRLGQCFITDPNLLRAVAAAAQLSPTDRVLEVGAGSGWLTRLLAEQAGHAVAIEIDSRLYTYCRETLADLPNLTLIEGDALESKSRLNPQMVDAMAKQSGDLKVVANLPYQISSPFLVLLYESGLMPTRVVVTVQLEMAQRLTASPGSKLYGPVTATINYFARAKIVRRISPGLFWPPPKVDSAVVQLDPLCETPDVPFDTYRRTVQACFQHRRKTLPSALRSGLKWPTDAATAAVTAAGLDKTMRAADLSVEQFAALAQQIGDVQ